MLSSACPVAWQSALHVHCTTQYSGQGTFRWLPTCSCLLAAPVFVLWGRLRVLLTQCSCQHVDVRRACCSKRHVPAPACLSWGVQLVAVFRALLIAESCSFMPACPVYTASQLCGALSCCWPALLGPVRRVQRRIGTCCCVGTETAAQSCRSCPKCYASGAFV
jgi:hypothetical protein